MMFNHRARNFITANITKKVFESGGNFGEMNHNGKMAIFSIIQIATQISARRCIGTRVLIKSVSN
ncbi:hypothetical protein D3C72_2146670 [compost metagenome]